MEFPLYEKGGSYYTSITTWPPYKYEYGGPPYIRVSYFPNIGLHSPEPQVHNHEPNVRLSKSLRSPTVVAEVELRGELYADVVSQCRAMAQKQQAPSKEQPQGVLIVSS